METFERIVESDAFFPVLILLLVVLVAVFVLVIIINRSSESKKNNNSLKNEIDESNQVKIIQDGEEIEKNDNFESNIYEENIEETENETNEVNLVPISDETEVEEINELVPEIEKVEEETNELVPEVDEIEENTEKINEIDELNEVEEIKEVEEIVNTEYDDINNVVGSINVEENEVETEVEENLESNEESNVEEIVSNIEEEKEETEIEELNSLNDITSVEDISNELLDDRSEVFPVSEEDLLNNDYANLADEVNNELTYMEPTFDDLSSEEEIIETEEIEEVNESDTSEIEVPSLKEEITIEETEEKEESKSVFDLKPDGNVSINENISITNPVEYDGEKTEIFDFPDFDIYEEDNEKTQRIADEVMEEANRFIESIMKQGEE